MMSLASQARECFAHVYGRAPETVAVAPGRVNLIGEHTDYNDGFVLPMALERGVAAAFAIRRDRVIRAHAAAFNETEEFAIDTVAPGTVSGWITYVASIAWAFKRAGLPVAGVDLAIVSDVPVAAGLSSSAALQMVVSRALVAATNNIWHAPKFARVALDAENQFVGVACGIMDQFTSGAAIAGSALLLDCRSLETRQVPIPPAASVIVMYTGVKRSLAASEYNERRAACEAAVAAIVKLAPAVRALRDVDRPLLERARPSMSETVYRRARHVVDEIQRPLAMVDALERSELRLAGRLMNESHQSLRDLYEVSSPELDAIVAEARSQLTCYGARLAGAGFGGCAVALIDGTGTDAFIDQVRRGYFRRTGREADIFASRPAAG